MEGQGKISEVTSAIRSLPKRINFHLCCINLEEHSVQLLNLACCLRRHEQEPKKQQSPNEKEHKKPIQKREEKWY